MYAKLAELHLNIINTEGTQHDETIVLNFRSLNVIIQVKKA